MNKLMKVHLASLEFIQDWRKGDFKLPKLAALDAEVIEKALIEHAEARKNTSLGQYILDNITQMSLFKITKVDDNYIIVWSSGAVEQIDAIIDKYYNDTGETK